jgi:hypothetical protein
MGEHPKQLLPWEGDAEPAGTGICLSGGGLRAASFALGAVQALQDHRGLLYGPKCADHLAVVSGGSYLGATLLLNAASMPTADGARPPLGAGTAEAEHVIANGSYLRNRRTAAKLATGVAVNLLTFVALFVWAAVLLWGAIVMANAFGVEAPADPTWEVIVAIVFVLAARIALRGVYLAGGPWRYLLSLLGGAVVVITSPAALGTMQRVPALSEPGWWTHGWRWLAALAVGAFVIAASFALATRWPQSPPTRVLAWLAARLPALAGGVGFCLLATAFAPELETGTRTGWLIFVIGVLGAGVMALVGRTSLHGMYRDGLATCFSVRRSASGIEPVGPTDQHLSCLRPPDAKGARSFPRLLVCATANVVWRPDRYDRSPLFRPALRGKRRFASFVYSHDRCGLPGVPDASFATQDLEKLTTPAGIFGRERLVSLMTAVASTGAAVSPAMGRRTSEVARPALALANLRLGRWVPNPLSARIRRDLEKPDADRRMRRRIGIGGAYDEFVPELFGLHQSDAARVYISDGGHYDNLGLLALLQARCADIWCVDSQADPAAGAGQLQTVIKLAHSELDVTVDIDPSGLPGSEPGILSVGHMVGTIHYPDAASTGRLVVIKLGLVRGNDSQPLFDYRAVDRGFAHHSTFWPPLRVMWYGPERFEKYRAVGYANALAASEAVTPV